MSLEEEYENQQSWRTSCDKLTFIVCEPLEGIEGGAAHEPVKAGEADADERMRGDINFFLYVDEDDDEDEEAEDGMKNKKNLIGEVDVMIAAKEHRGRGIGEAAVRALLTYIWGHLDEILKEYTDGDEDLKRGEDVTMSGLMVKIKEGNKGSRALFGKLGFRQKGEVNYFGEVTMTMSWEDLVKEEHGVLGDAAMGEMRYHEVEYEGLRG